ncbi:MAG: HEAT repeat domain-containing protein [Roseivirga sp.]
MYTQYQKGLSMVLLTSLFLQSCGNLALNSQHRMTGEDDKVAEQQPTAEQAPPEAALPASPEQLPLPLPPTAPGQQSPPSSAATSPQAAVAQAQPADSEEGEEEKKEAPQLANEPHALQKIRAVSTPLFNRALANPKLALEGLEIYKKFILRYESELARKSLPTVYQKWFVEMEDEEVRTATLKTLGFVAKVAPDTVPQVLGLLLAAAHSESSEVTSEALRSLGKLVKVAPNQAEVVLTTLLAVAQESNPDVRIAALEALLELSKATPQHAKAVLTALLAAAGDRRPDVRRAASKALGELSKAAPQHAEAVLPALLSAAGDSEGLVRRDALEALSELAQAAPHLVNEAARSALLKAAGDWNSAVRIAAIAALLELTKAAPQHAEAVLSVLVKAAGDWHPAARIAASTALSELAKAAPSEAVLEALFAAAGDSDDPLGYVRRAASEALDSIALQQLIQAGIHSRKQELIHHIVRRLYATPLIVQESQQPGYQELVLYPSAKPPEVVGTYPQADVERFVQAIRAVGPSNAAPQVQAQEVKQEG